MAERAPSSARRVSNVAGILGIIKLRLGKAFPAVRVPLVANSQLTVYEDKYIIVITKAQSVGKLKGHIVYRVVATEFLQLHERPLHDAEEDAYLSMLKALIKSSPVYFSYTMDLTNSFQRQAQSDLSSPLWKRADDRFFWNRFIQTDLIDFRSGGGAGSISRQRGATQPGVDPFILPVMYGMMEITYTSIKSTPLTFVLITRRSRHRAGTRYFSRGIDEHGHVSNYNETEQIVVVNDLSAGLGGFAGGFGAQDGHIGEKNGKETQVLSYVQTRGSVPVYWAEVNDLHYTPKLEIRGVDVAINAAQEHFKEQIRIYGDNYLVNLVNHKGREDRIKGAYEQVVRLLVSDPSESRHADSITDEKLHLVEPSQKHQEFDRLHYIYFDFHNETKGMRWSRVQLLLDQLGEALNRQQYFRGVDMPGDLSGRMEVRNYQTSVVRSNCMDCLDRTNLVQSVLARWTLDRMLTDLGILESGRSASDDASFEHLFRNVWADNADVVSKSYSGTGALKTDFTRTGKRTKAGMLQDIRASLTRYVRNNFADGPKQDGFDLFLGAFLPSSAAVGKTSLFTDRRPVLIQSIPYLLATSIFMILMAAVTQPLPDTATLPLRVFVLLWLVLGLWSFQFIRSHGTFYVRSATSSPSSANKLSQVNWPKLNRPPWAIENYNAALASVQNGKVTGKLVGRHDRRVSNARLGHLEEGKKRIE